MAQPEKPPLHLDATPDVTYCWEPRPVQRTTPYPSRFFAELPQDRCQLCQDALFAFLNYHQQFKPPLRAAKG